MTIAVEKLKQASIKFYLVRITPARHISNLVTSLGGGVYSYTFAHPVSSVERNGVALTSVALDPPTVNDTYNFNELTGVLKIKTAAVPDEDTNVLVMFYRLYFSDGPTEFTDDPLDSATTVRDWLPYMTSPPSITTSFSDQSFGVLSTQASSVGIANPDRFIQKLLTSEDSFFRKAVEIWIGINDSILKVFTGRVESVRVENLKATIDVLDSTSVLDRIALMGDSVTDAYTPDSNVTRFSRAPIPYIFGRSRYGYVSDIGSNNPTIIGQNIDYRRSETAKFRGNTSVTISETTNRGPWTCARTSSAGFKQPSYTGVVNSIIVSDQAVRNFTYHGRDLISVTIQFSVSHTLEIGDTLRWDAPSFEGGLSQYCIVTTLVGTDTVICMQWSRNGVYYSPGVMVLASINVDLTAAPALVLVQSGKAPYLLARGRDFTTSTTTTTAGNKRIDITLVSNFESAVDGAANRIHPDLDPVDPSSTDIYFRATQYEQSNTHYHGTCVSDLLTRAAMTVNSASITAANGTAAKVSFSIPLEGEPDFLSYRSYLQAVLASTLGYVKTDQDGEASYILLGQAGAGDTVSDDNSWDATSRVNYTELVSEITPVNRNIPASVTSYESAKAKYLHGGSSTKVFDNLLVDIAPRSDEILAFLSSPSTTTSVRASLEFIESVLGDDLSADLAVVPGDSTQKNVKITSMTISKDGISIEASGFDGV
jgi:hypothetical protein